METLLQRVLQAGLCSGTQLVDRLVSPREPGQRTAQALQLGRVVLAAQAVEVFLGGADVALLALKFFLHFLQNERTP